MQQNDRVKAEKAILVGLSADCFRPEENATDESLDELEALLETAGGICEAKVLQNRHTPDPQQLHRRGKGAEYRPEGALRRPAPVVMVEHRGAQGEAQQHLQPPQGERAPADRISIQEKIAEQVEGRRCPARAGRR